MTSDTLLPLRAEERELLSGHVVVIDDRASVLFAPLGVVGEGDYVRFALHYYARALFELVRVSQSARDLPALIDAITSTGLDHGADVFALAGLSGSLSRILDDPQASEADCVLFSTAHREFHLRGDFSRLDSRTLVRSVIAVIQAVLERVSVEMADLLTNALANMNASYGVTHRYSDAHSLDQVPSNAFHAAAFV
ncbi:MAG: hypothetical protein DMF56_09925 [Acidobacteria bacterium]|nr:MAG: hypothetical protein DMF56_09925 [Acidobacteriota bacterium]